MREAGNAMNELVDVVNRVAGMLGEIIKCHRLTQSRAAEIMGIPQPKVSALLRGPFRGISEAKMLEAITGLGREAKIVIGPLRRRSPPAILNLRWLEGESRGSTSG